MPQNNAFSLLVGLLASAFIFLGENPVVAAQSTYPTNVTISEHPVILVVSFDGFGANYFSKVATPAMEALRESGIRTHGMDPIFPTNTFPNHQSIATGLYAESHGIIDNVFYDPLYNKSLSGFTDDPGYWNYHPDVLPIWILNEMAGEGRASGCLLWPGSSQPYGPNNDSLPTYYYPGYDDYTLPWIDRVEIALSWITNDTNPANLVFLYNPEPDIQGHAYGPNAPETIQEIRNADNRTQYLVDRLHELGIFDKINLIMLSDHGMEAVSPSRVSNVSELIEANSELLERLGGGNPVLHLRAKEGKIDELYDALRVSSDSHNFTIFKRDEMGNRFNYAQSRRIMDLVMISDPGHAFDDFYAQILKEQNNRPNLEDADGDDQEEEYGVHGYSSEAPAMRPLFLASGPDFQRLDSNDIIKNVDVVPLISKILGIPEPPNNGSLARVEKFIRPRRNNASKIIMDGACDGNGILC